jgi:2-isopropylmalate synthase
MGDPAVVRIFDTSLRDGEQAPGFSMTVPEKLRLARQLDALGVDIIEAGFPIASDGDFAAVRCIAAEVRRPVIAGLARAVPVDVECAARAVERAARPRLHVFLATSDLHLRDKLRISPPNAWIKLPPPSVSPGAMPTMLNSPLKTRRAVTSSS